MNRAVDALWRTLSPATTEVDDEMRRVWSSPELLEGLWPLIEVEDMEPWLDLRLRDLGLRLPAPWDAALEHATAVAAAQALLLREELAALAAILAPVGIPWAVIKGGARLFHEGGPLVRARRVADCDILVPRAARDTAVATLERAGYVRVGEGAPAGHWHADPLRRDRMAVEVHHALDRDDDADRTWRRVEAGARAVTFGDASVLVPSATELFWHALRHRLASPITWLRFRTVADVASVLPMLGRPELDEIARRLSGEATTVQERLYPVVRAVGAFADAELAPGLGVPRGDATPMRQVLLWRLAEYWRHEDPSSRRAESGRMAPYFVLGHPADAVETERSVPRRMLDALAITEFRQLLDDQPAS